MSDEPFDLAGALAIHHRAYIPNWHPTRLNVLLTSHHMRAHRLKQADAGLLAHYLNHVPRATGKRRVTLTIVLGKGQRGGDTDAYWKTLLDGLKRAGLIVDDNRQWCELEPVRFERGKMRATIVELKDLDIKQGGGS